MGKGKRDMKPVFLKIGLALAVSLGGMLFTFLRNKRIKPSRSPNDPPKSSDCNNQVNSPGRESWASKGDNFASHTTPNSSQFDPLATNRHVELHNSMPDLSPSSKSNIDKDACLLPEFNDLMKEFDMAAMKTDTELPISDTEYPRVIKDIHEQEIKTLKNLVKTLKERERNLETKLLEYYGLKGQETAVMELQNRLKLNNMEAKLFTLKIESLRSDNRRLEAQMADYSKVVSDLEAARARIKLLKKKLRSESAHNKERILDLQKRVQKMQEDEHKGIVGIDSDVQFRKLKDLEAEADELRKSNNNLQLEKSELAQRLEHVQILATSVLEDDETEKLKEESQHLKKQNEDLTKEIEQLQADRCTDVEELVYLRWINACLRYELRNYKPGPDQTTARDLSKTLSPKSEEKAKQLILEYANKEGVPEKGINFQELDFSQWSSSHASNSGDLDESSGSDNRIFRKLMKMFRGKDSHGHSRNSSLERMEFINDLNSTDSQRSMCFHKRVDSLAEGGCSYSRSSLDSQRSELEKYAEVLKDSHSKLRPKFRRRSAPFSSF